MLNFLVIGSGIAGLFFALKAAKLGHVTIITKDTADAGATTYAQGGIAAALGAWDNPEKHFADTLSAGAGLCDEKAVEILVNEGVERVNELIAMGMPFTRDDQGKLDFGREGGHNEFRVVHTNDHTGRSLEVFLLEKINAHPQINILSNHCVIDLISEHHLPQPQTSTQIFGAYVLDSQTGAIHSMTADYTILATGGAGRIYPFTTNPRVSTGDGVAIAYRAGCRIRNMEFFQFHPTALYAKADPAFLVSEAVRGHGAILKTPDGKPFMHNYHELKDLAPRDIVARAIDSELKKGGIDNVLLDITHKDRADIEKHFPLISSTLKEKFNIDMATQMIPVVPAAHYMCGGILVNTESQTDLDHLYAIGETASTGVHGGNRLASNSLLEGIVFAERAVNHIAKTSDMKKVEAMRRIASTIQPWDHSHAKNTDEWVLIRHDFKEIRSLMWDYVGIVRSKLRLERALRRIDVIYGEIIDYYKRTIISRDLLELRNLALVAQITIRSAMARDESRGLHFMIEHAESRDKSRKDTVLTPVEYRERLGKEK